MHAHRSIDLRVGADAGRSLFNAALESGLRPSVDVLNGEGALDRLHASHVVRLRPTRLRRAPVDDSRLIEVDVRFDQTGATQEPAGVVAGCICRDHGLDGGDAAVRDAYIYGSVFRPG